jgi:hypothetical protein
MTQVLGEMTVNVPADHFFTQIGIHDDRGWWLSLIGLCKKSLNRNEHKKNDRKMHW